MAALRAHRSRQAQERLLMGAGYQDGDWVFAHPAGTHLHPNVVTRWFYGHVAAAGLRRIRLHDVRHLAVTAMLHQGIPVKVVSERVGHSSTSFTQDVYATALPHMQEEAPPGSPLPSIGLTPVRHRMGSKTRSERNG